MDIIGQLNTSATDLSSDLADPGTIQENIVKASRRNYFFIFHG
jgi:hypothetical protein